MRKEILMTEHDAGSGVPALRTERLGRRYGKVWGLRDCTFEVPAGAVTALVGPNGAGKTTLLEMIIGLLEPSEGQVSVFGETSQAGTAATLARVGYVAQDHPLYRDFTVADMFHLGRAMNPSWDQRLAEARAGELDIPLKRRVKKLSGGQQAQISLTMALAKRASLLVLDEPVSSHQLLTIPRGAPDAELPGVAIQRTDSGQHSTVVVRTDPGRASARQRPGWQADPVGFEQLIMAYLQRPTSPTTHDDPAPAARRPGPSTKETAQ
jgi:ABC-type transport system involved in cytochrome c biogenesis ATPase subunit